MPPSKHWHKTRTWHRCKQSWCILASLHQSAFFLTPLHVLLCRHFIQGPVCLYGSTISPSGSWFSQQQSTLRELAATMPTPCCGSSVFVELQSQLQSDTKSISILRPFEDTVWLGQRGRIGGKEVGSIRVCAFTTVTPWCLLLRKTGSVLSSSDSSVYQQAT